MAAHLDQEDGSPASSGAEANARKPADSPVRQRNGDLMHNEMTRRSFVKGTLLSSAGVALGMEARGESASTPPAPAAGAAGALPKAKIGKLEVSRLILGGNLLTHYTHSRDLKYVYTLAAHYNTDEKIMETLALAETPTASTPFRCTTRRIRSPCSGAIARSVAARSSGSSAHGAGRAGHGQVSAGHRECSSRTAARRSISGACMRTPLVAQGKMDWWPKPWKPPRNTGCPLAWGRMRLDVVKACEKQGIKADFYIKTFHQP